MATESEAPKVDFTSESDRARACLTAAADHLLAAALAYREAWHQQAEALASMGGAFEAVHAAVGTNPSAKVAAAVGGYDAAASSAALLHIPMGEEGRLSLEREVRALEVLAGAARRIAHALAAPGGDA